MVSYHGRFKDEKGRYEEIRDILINDLIELGLDVVDSYKVIDKNGRDQWESVGQDREAWKTLFKNENGYLELYISECYGNWSKAMEYIEKSFIKKYGDVKVEFVITAYYDDGVSVERILYDGEKINKETPVMETPICPICQSFDFELIDENLYRCAVCNNEFCEEEFMYDYRYVFEIN